MTGTAVVEMGTRGEAECLPGSILLRGETFFPDVPELLKLSLEQSRYVTCVRLHEHLRAQAPHQ